LLGVQRIARDSIEMESVVFRAEPVAIHRRRTGTY
jgi:hypothetical protein